MRKTRKAFAWVKTSFLGIGQSIRVGGHLRSDWEKENGRQTVAKGRSLYCRSEEWAESLPLKNIVGSAPHEWGDARIGSWRIGGWFHPFTGRALCRNLRS